MGRGSGDQNRAAGITARRSRIFDGLEGASHGAGRPWMEHVRELKQACVLMMDLVQDSEPAGLTLSDIGNTALYCAWIKRMLRSLAICCASIAEFSWTWMAVGI